MEWQKDIENIIPPEDKLRPKEDILVSKEDRLRPKEDILVSKEDRLRPKEDILVPKEDRLRPKEDILVPKEDRLRPKEDILVPKESFLDYAKMVGELPPETIDKLVMAVISSYPNYDKTKIISDWFRTCPPEKVQEFISICLTKSLDDAIPEIVALLGTQPTTEVEEPTIKF